MKDYYLIKSINTEMAMLIYDLLKNDGLFVKIVATPNSLGEGCGLSIRINNQDYLTAKKLINYYIDEHKCFVYKTVNNNDEYVHNYIEVKE